VEVRDSGVAGGWVWLWKAEGKLAWGHGLRQAWGVGPNLGHLWGIPLQ
jgi:hypothetical protein